eukprot:TRINITY_DN14458_c2_g1_i1.p2 TRINITY_DN14458_c2_g1~~TRINITY_DN14458_c2_g1_i1.p2  ORF type:complete len:114 (+),score=7.27 TRINITY_DN14458_c2_g1_i1:191-532(+)
MTSRSALSVISPGSVRISPGVIGGFPWFVEAEGGLQLRQATEHDRSLACRPRYRIFSRLQSSVRNISERKQALGYAGNSERIQAAVSKLRPSRCPWGRRFRHYNDPRSEHGPY